MPDVIYHYDYGLVLGLDRLPLAGGVGIYRAPDASGNPGPVAQLLDTTNTAIDSLTVSRYGTFSQYNVANCRRGYLDFGAGVILPVLSIEAQDAYDVAVQAAATAQDAVTAAQEALQELQAYVAAHPSTGGGLAANVTLEDIPNGPSRVAMTTDERAQLAKVPATFLKVGTAATDAKRGDYAPTAEDVKAVRNVGGFGRVWGNRTATQGPPTAAEGAVDGDYCFVDAVS